MTIKETFNLILAFVIVVTVVFLVAVVTFMSLGYGFNMEALYAYLIVIVFLVTVIPLVVWVTELIDL
jgi:hypothetical protein